MRRRRLLLAALIVVAVVVFFALDAGRYLNLDFFRAQQDALIAYRQAHPLQAALGYFLCYVLVTGLSLPGAAILTLAGGALFGLLWGTLIVSFASSIGATAAFLASRYVLRDWVQQRFGRQLRPINEGLEKEGGFYLFTLRLVPAFPYVLVNLLMGLTPLPARTFYWVSQVGMLAVTVVYVNAGRELAQVHSVLGILSPGLILSMSLLGVFPLAAKKVLDAIRAGRVYARWRRPERFDRNLVVIGAGSAGLVAAYVAATLRARVTLVERHRMGGDCLNTGCVPSKALLKTARVLAQIRRAREYGLSGASADFDFAKVMERVQRVVATVAPHDSAERYRGLGVECLEGDAKIVSPWEVEVREPSGDVRRLTTRSIVIAAGARPYVPPIQGLDEVGYLTSDTVWNLRSLPRRLVVLGGGPVGSELAQAFARLGSKVTQVEMLPRILFREDPDVSAAVAGRFREEGVEVLADHKAKRFALESGNRVLIADHAGGEVRIEFDTVLVAVGRIANTAGYGLEELGIPLAPARTVQTNDTLQTIYPNIYACGDVAGPYQFTHTAAHQAWYAAANALFGGVHKFRADYSVIPWATFTEPEVARVGLNETQAQERGIPYELSTYSMADLDRAIADEEASGFVKVLTRPGRDTVLGVTIVGEHAGELIAEFVTAMRHGIGLNKILGTIHIYPTLAESNRYAAGAWRRAHAPRRLLALAEKFHAWMRG